jgi:hypothetical protein
VRQARRRVRVHWAIACAAASLLLVPASLARADAVPPPPAWCPPGRVPVTSHAGPKCELAPPKSCPLGYRGVVGGQCVLNLCWSDESCGKGRACRETSLCHHSRLVSWEFGEQRVERSNVLGAPPRRIDPPELRWEPKSICRREGDCAPPAECRAGKICYPIGRDLPPAPAPVPSARTDAGAGGAPGRNEAGDGSSGKATQQVEEPPAQTSPVGAPEPARSIGAPLAPSPTEERPTGCGRGCATAAPAGAALGIAVLGVVAALLLTRRRHG